MPALSDRNPPALFRWLFFPVTMALGFTAAHHLWESGQNTSSVIGLASLVAIATIALCECIYPHRQDWATGKGDVPTDIAHNFVTGYALREWLKIGILMSVVPFVAALSQRYGLALWPASLPMPLQVALAAVVSEFGGYWIHRIQHERDFFWRFHAVHHSPHRIYWLNAGRDHPLGMVLDYSGGALLLILCGAPAEPLVYFYVFESVMGLIQHANVRHNMGWLDYIFSSAVLHRWHHSDRIEEANNNYGSSLILWDLVFGTYYNPPGRDEGPERIGLVSLQDFPQRFWGAWTVPFRWAAIKRANGVLPSSGN